MALVDQQQGTLALGVGKIGEQGLELLTGTAGCQRRDQAEVG